MKRVLLVCIFPVALLLSASSNSQSIAFQYVDTIPVTVNGDTLNNPWAGGINFPLFSEIDLNGDGIHDLFMYDRVSGRISTFINDGTPGVNAWHYAPQYISRFPPINKWALLYDYNCDGKMDLFTLSTSCYCGIAVYRNDYDPINGLHFTLITQTLNETFSTSQTQVYASSVSLPAFGDVDGDGDMDILGYGPLPDGRVVYHRNYAMENYGRCDTLVFALETQKWGNFAMNIGGSNRVSCFNCRLSHREIKNDFVNYDQSQAAVRDDSISSIFMIDMDGDGDKDLLIGDSGSTNTCLAINGGTPSVANMVSQDTAFPSNNVPVNMYYFTVHAYIDVDNDGVKDLLVSPTTLENLHGIWFYKNTGSNSVPDFHWQSNSFLADQMIDVGEGACPVLFDADGDGLQDLVIGNYGVFQNGNPNYKNGLYLFRNTGTLASPSFDLADNDFAGIRSMDLTGPIYPAFGDLDEDGAKDMIIGDDDGKLYYFHNIAGAGNPAVFQSPSSTFGYMHINVGNNSTPQLIDLNRDGLLDLVVGCKAGNIKYFQNTGTPTVPFFDSIPTVDTLGGVDLHTIATPDGYSVPYFFDQLGQYNLLASCSRGDVYLYTNIDSNLYGNFHFADTVITRTQGSRPYFNLAVSGGDLNNDGLTDMLLGLYGGGVGTYMQYHPSGISELTNVHPGFSISPNPSDGQCNIQFNHLISSERNQLVVMNYLGQPVFSKQIHGNFLTLESKDFPAGIYLVQLQSGKNSVMKKLVITH